MTARSSAIVLAARTLRMNCFTVWRGRAVSAMPTRELQAQEARRVGVSGGGRTGAHLAGVQKPVGGSLAMSRYGQRGEGWRGGMAGRSVAGFEMQAREGVWSNTVPQARGLDTLVSMRGRRLPRGSSGAATLCAGTVLGHQLELRVHT